LVRYGGYDHERSYQAFFSSLLEAERASAGGERLLKAAPRNLVADATTEMVPAALLEETPAPARRYLLDTLDTPT